MAKSPDLRGYEYFAPPAESVPHQIIALLTDYEFHGDEGWHAFFDDYIGPHVVGAFIDWMDKLPTLSLDQNVTWVRDQVLKQPLDMLDEGGCVQNEWGWSCEIRENPLSEEIIDMIRNRVLPGIDTPTGLNQEFGTQVDELNTLASIFDLVRKINEVNESTFYGKVEIEAGEQITATEAEEAILVWINQLLNWRWWRAGYYAANRVPFAFRTEYSGRGMPRYIELGGVKLERFVESLWLPSFVNNKQYISRFWGSWAKEYLEIADESVIREYVIRKIISELPNNPGRMLDLACGTGVITHYINELSEEKRPTKLVGIDLLDIMCRQAHFAGEEVAQADMMHLPFVDSTFDTVVCEFGIHWADDIVEVLREVSRVLKVGGWLLFNDRRLPVNWNNKMLYILGAAGFADAKLEHVHLENFGRPYHGAIVKAHKGVLADKSHL